MSHPIFNRHRPPRYAWSALLVAAGMASLWAAPPFVFAADGDAATSDLFEGGIVIPYEGSLMADGEEMSGVVTMRFFVESGSSIRYAETHEEVALYNGRFSVRLGTGTDPVGNLTDVVVDGDRLVLGISIADDTGAFVSLEGAQTIEPVAYSAWTAHAARLAVAGTLTVDGNVLAPDGELGAPSLTATGQVLGATVESTRGDITATGQVSATLDMTVGGSLRAGVDVTADGSITAGTVTANEIFGNSATITGHAETRSLTINSSSQLGPVHLAHGLGSATDMTGEERIHFRLLRDDRPFEVLGGDVDVVGGNIRTTGNVVANSNSRPGSNCSWTPWHQRTVHFSGSAPSTSDDASYNERECPDGRFMAAMDFRHDSGANRTHDERVRIYCCQL